MEPTSRRQILLVAHRTAATQTLLDEVRRRAAERSSEFVLLLPDAMHRETAERTLARALPLVERAAGRPVAGLVGGSDPFEAVRRTVAERRFDEIVIFTQPSRISRWLRRDLPRRVAELGPPVTVVTAGLERPLRRARPLESLARVDE
jgi:hypothetical protein